MQNVRIYNDFKPRDQNIGLRECQIGLPLHLLSLQIAEKNDKMSHFCHLKSGFRESRVRKHDFLSMGQLMVETRSYVYRDSCVSTSTFEKQLLDQSASVKFCRCVIKSFMYMYR